MSYRMRFLRNVPIAHDVRFLPRILQNMTTHKHINIGVLLKLGVAQDCKWVLEMGAKVDDTFTMRVISTFLSEAAAVKSREKNTTGQWCYGQETIFFFKTMKSTWGTYRDRYKYIPNMFIKIHLGSSKLRMWIEKKGEIAWIKSNSLFPLEMLIN